MKEYRCPRCGSAAVSGEMYCRYCGTPIEKIGNMGYMDHNSGRYRTKQKSSHGLAVAAIVICVLAFAMMGTTIAILLARDHDSGTDSVDSPDITVQAAAAAATDAPAAAAGSGTSSSTTASTSTSANSSAAASTPAPTTGSTATPAPTLHAAATAAPVVTTAPSGSSWVYPSDYEYLNSPYYAYPRSGGIRIRTGPGLSYTVLDTLYSSYLYVMATREVYESSLKYGNTWAYVQYSGGYGWCYLPYLDYPVTPCYF